MANLNDISLEELQAQFKSIQQEESKHRLSERNCVELVVKLINLGLINVIYTLSGREYLTPKQLQREILDELLQHRGRVNVVELQPLLNVDLSHIQTKVDEILRKDRQIRLIDGELISGYYLDGVAEEINEALQESGELKVADLAARFSLTSNIIEEIIQRRLGKSIKGTLDDGMLYTEAFVARHKAQIRGIFSAITRPTSIPSILNKHKFNERLFFTLLNQLVDEKRIHGTVQGKAMYIPAVFSHARTQWIDTFYKQNNIIDYRTLERLQIEKPKNWLMSRYKEGIALASTFVHKQIVDQVDALVAEVTSTDSYIDVSPYIPLSLGEEDVAILLQTCPSTQEANKTNSIQIFGDKYVVSKAFLDRCIKLYEQHIKDSIAKGLLEKPKDITESKEKVKETAAPPKPKRTDDDDDEDTGKRSRGKGRRQRNNNNRDESVDSKSSKGSGKKGKSSKQEPDFVAENLPEFKKWFEDEPEDLLEFVIAHLQPTLEKIKLEASRAVFVEAAEARQKNSNFQEELTTLYLNIQLFEKGIQHFQSDELLLEKHLLKTLCNDLVNRIVFNQALHHFIDVETIDTPAQRNAVVSKLPSNISAPLQKLIGTLTGKTVKDFLTELDNVADVCQLMLVGLDKKRERQVLLQHRQALLDQISKETNPATIFHSVLVTLYLKKHNVMIHATGRVLATLLGKLKSVVSEDAHALLSEYHALVVNYLTNPGDKSVEEKLQEKTPAVKELVLGKE